MLGNGDSYVSCLIGKWRIGGEARRQAIRLTVWVFGAKRIETRHRDAKGVSNLSLKSRGREGWKEGKGSPRFLSIRPPLASGSPERLQSRIQFLQSSQARR